MYSFRPIFCDIFYHECHYIPTRDIRSRTFLEVRISWNTAWEKRWDDFRLPSDIPEKMQYLPGWSLIGAVTKETWSSRSTWQLQHHEATHSCSTVIRRTTVICRSNRYLSHTCLSQFVALLPLFVAKKTSTVICRNTTVICRTFFYWKRSRLRFEDRSEEVLDLNRST